MIAIISARHNAEDTGGNQTAKYCTITRLWRRTLFCCPESSPQKSAGLFQDIFENCSIIFAGIQKKVKTYRNKYLPEKALWMPAGVFIHCAESLLPRRLIANICWIGKFQESCRAFSWPYLFPSESRREKYGNFLPVSLRWNYNMMGENWGLPREKWISFLGLLLSRRGGKQGLPSDLQGQKR